MQKKTNDTWKQTRHVRAAEVHINMCVYDTLVGIFDWLYANIVLMEKTIQFIQWCPWSQTYKTKNSSTAF